MALLISSVGTASVTLGKEQDQEEGCPTAAGMVAVAVVAVRSLLHLGPVLWEKGGSIRTL